MTGTKIVIIVLVLIVVLFVVFVVWGNHNNDPKGKGSDKNQDPNAAAASYSGYLDGLSGLFGSGGPKVDAADLSPQSFDLQKQVSYTIHIKADSAHTLRQVKVKVQPSRAQTPNVSCAEVIFTSPNGSPAPFDKAMDTYGKDPEVKKRNDFTVAVGKGGGTLQIQRSPNYTWPCTVRLD